MRIAFTFFLALVINELFAQGEAASSYQRATELYRQGKMAESYEQAWRAAATTKASHGMLSAEYADNLRLLSLIAATSRKDSLALSYTLQEIESRKRSTAPFWPSLIQAHLNASSLYLLLGNAEQAQSAVYDALTIQDSTGVWTDSLDYLQLSAAKLFQATEDYQAADSLYNLIHTSSLNRSFDEQLVVKARYYQSLLRDSLSYKDIHQWMSRLQQLGDTTNDLYANLCYHRANLLLQQDNWQQARKWYTVAKTIYEKKSAPEQAIYSSVLNNLGVVALADGDEGVGGHFIEEAYQLRAKQVEYGQGSFWMVLANLAAYLYENENSSEALALYNKHIHLEDTTINYPWEYAIALNNMASIHQNEGNYDIAGQYFNRALEVLNRDTSSEQTALLHQASIYSNAAQNYQNLVRFDTAIYYHQKSIELIKQAVGRHSLAYVAAISGIAALYHDIGYLIESGIFFQEAINIQKELSGSQNNFYANLLNNYALVCQSKGEFRKAAELLEESISIKEDLLGSEHPDYLAALSNIGLLYFEEGKYAQARPILELVVEIQRDKWGTEHPAMINSYLNLARLEIQTGNYPEAEPLLQQALRLSVEHFGETHPEHAKVQLEMANFYFTLGNFVTAKPILLESQQVLLDSYGAFYPDLATAYQSLAALYEAQDSVTLAEQYYQKALNIDINTLGKQHPSYAATLSNLATLYQNNGNYEKALPLLEESLAISEGLLGKEHPFYSTTLLNLGLLYQDVYQYKKAADLIEEAVTVRREVLGELHPDYAYALYSQAVLYHKLEQYEKAETVFYQVIDNYIQQVQNYFPALSEQEKSAYFQRVEPVFNAFRDFVIDQAYYRTYEVEKDRRQRLLAGLYNLQLVTKAMLLDASYQLRQAIVSQGDIETISQYERWIAVKEKLGQLYTLSRQERDEQQVDIESLEDEANQLEKQLSRKSATFATTVDSKQVTWKQVQRQLKSGEAAVEIIRIAKDTTTFYAALVLEPEDEAPRLCFLPQGKKMENKNYYYYQNAIKFRITDELSYEQYWQPIRAELSDQVQTIYLAPDGVYYKININSLYHEEKQRYVIDEIDIRMVSSTRDLTQENEHQSTKQAYLIGYPDFQYQVGFQSSEAFQDTMTTQTSESTNILISTPFLFGINELPGTQAEVEIIDRLLEEEQWRAYTYLAEQAQEKVIKSVKSPRLLHIATHGYFMTDLSATENGKAYGIHLQNISANPLLRAGLLLAGAERSIYQNSVANWQAEDGILTAYEAMNLQLSGTELVVLSACETGLGDVKNGEGVYGLQRAFLVAGAQNVLMSLWNVNDNSTAELMTLFYQYWLSGQNKHKALRNAQLAIKEQRSEPYYWGGFVLIGR